MGSFSSKSRAAKRGKTDHSPLPLDQVPYPGPPIEYSFIEVPVRIKASMTFNWAPGQTLATSDIDSYYKHLSDRYNEGFYLISFFRVPGAVSAGFISATCTVPFKGVFARQVGFQGRRPYQLRIHKSMIHLHLLRSGILFGMDTAVDTNISHVYSLINEECLNGARFLCMELTGGQQSQGMGLAVGGVSPALGLDVYFEIPDQPVPALYTMQAVSVPIHINYTFGSPSVEIVCDWMGTLAFYLNQGWKLSDIFVASPSSHSTRATVYNINTIWFFEKETAKLDDNTPLYEGTFVEYYAKVKVGFGSVSCKLELAPILAEMGSRGWDLVCMVETPKVISMGFGSVTTVMLLVFQRPLLGRAPTQIGTMPPTGVGMQPAASAIPPGAAYPSPHSAQLAASGMPPGATIPVSYAAQSPPSYNDATKGDSGIYTVISMNPEFQMKSLNVMIILAILLL